MLRPGTEHGTEEEAVELGGAWKTKFADLEANNTVRDASGQGPEMTMITVIGHWSPWL